MMIILNALTRGDAGRSILRRRAYLMGLQA
jgi:hypothetical protein